MDILNTLRNAHKDYNAHQITLAELCQDKIKKMLPVFKELDIPTTWIHWQESSFWGEISGTTISVSLGYNKLAHDVQWFHEDFAPERLFEANKELRAGMCDKLDELVQRMIKDLSL
jgi:hypothetical protein